MVDENEVKRWIARLETEESSWTNYEKLAALYIIRNEHGGEQLQAVFCRACAGQENKTIRQ